MSDMSHRLPCLAGRQLLACAPTPDGRWWVVAEVLPGFFALATVVTLTDAGWDTGEATLYGTSEGAFREMGDALTAAYAAG